MIFFFCVKLSCLLRLVVTFGEVFSDINEKKKNYNHFLDVSSSLFSLNERVRENVYKKIKK